MRKIRKLYCFDKKKALEMISFLNNSANDNYINNIMFNPFIPLHSLLPLRLKFLPESYVLKDDRDIKGLITVAPIRSVNKKIEIKKLFFEENAYDYASELVQYVVSRYKAMGSPSIVVKVDDYMPELLSMFITKCNFSQISYEKLWQINIFPNSAYDKREYRIFRNSDAQIAANIYNESLLPLFRPILSSDVSEFREPIFKGIQYYSEYKYTIKDKFTGNITGFIIIQTADNENYILEILKSGWAEIDINAALTFATDKIKKRNKKFCLFVKTKRYLNTSETFEKTFMENNYVCVQNQILLTNSSMKVIKNTEKSGKYTILNNFCPSNIMPT